MVAAWWAATSRTNVNNTSLPAILTARSLLIDSLTIVKNCEQLTLPLLTFFSLLFSKRSTEICVTQQLCIAKLIHTVNSRSIKWRSVKDQFTCNIYPHSISVEKLCLKTILSNNNKNLIIWTTAVAFRYILPTSFPGIWYPTSCLTLRLIDIGCCFNIRNLAERLMIC